MSSLFYKLLGPLGKRVKKTSINTLYSSGTSELFSISPNIHKNLLQ